MCSEGNGGTVTARSAPSLIVGLGNPLLCDDGAGILLAREVHRLLGDERVELREAAVGGLELMDLLEGRERAVVIDSILLEDEEPGELFLLDLEGPLAESFDGGSHHLGLLEGLEVARRLRIPMPGYLKVYALQVEDPFTFREGLTPKVAAALPSAAEKIARETRSRLCFRGEVKPGRNL